VLAHIPRRNSFLSKRHYFGTDGIRGPVGEKPISADWILQLGWAFGTVLAKTNQRPSVLIGKDTRVSGYMLETAMEAGLASAGVDIHLVGPMPTPAIAYLTRTLRMDAGIVISASHNPYSDNGIKFFSGQGTKLPDELELEIEAELEKPMMSVDSRRLGKASRVRDAQGRYIEFCKATFPSSLDLRGIKMVVDCANGATYQVAPYIFRELGAEVIEIGAKPNGFNINDNCGSTFPKPLCDMVTLHQADVGIAFDGDGDRLVMVDEKGAVVDGDELLFIIAKWYADTQRLTGGVVGTVMSNLGLELAFKSMNIPFCRTKVGDRYILEMLKQKNWNLGGESSGHLICLDANTTGDGIISALRVLAFVKSMGTSLAEAKRGMVKFPQTLINVPIHASAAFNMELPTIQMAIKKGESQLKDRGRVLLRSSGTEPVVRVMVEGEDPKLVERVATELAQAVSSAV